MKVSFIKNVFDSCVAQTCFYRLLLYFLALSSRSVKTSNCVGSCPAASSGLCFSSQSDVWICCRRVPIRESRLFECMSDWPLITAKFSSANKTGSVLMCTVSSLVWTLEVLSVWSLHSSIVLVSSLLVVPQLSSCSSHAVRCVSSTEEPWSSSNVFLILCTPEKQGCERNKCQSHLIPLRRRHYKKTGTEMEMRAIDRPSFSFCSWSLKMILNQPGDTQLKAWPQLSRTLCLRKHLHRDSSSANVVLFRYYTNTKTSYRNRLNLTDFKSVDAEICSEGAHFAQVCPDEETRTPVQERYVQFLQLFCHEAVSLS